MVYIGARTQYIGSEIGVSLSEKTNDFVDAISHRIDGIRKRCYLRERSGSVVECLTRDRGAAGSSLTVVTALWSLSKTHLS